MTDRDEFLAWIHGPLYEAELALHNGDPGPRRALWSHNEPVSVLGAWRNANGQREVDVDGPDDHDRCGVLGAARPLAVDHLGPSGERSASRSVRSARSEIRALS